MIKRTYIDIRAELDGVVGKLQAVETDIDQAMELHKQAEKLLAELEAYLKQVEKTIKKK